MRNTGHLAARLRATSAPATTLAATVAALPGAAYADDCNVITNPANGNITCVLNTNGAPGAPAPGSGSDPVFNDKDGSAGGPGVPAGGINLDVGFNPNLFDYTTFDRNGTVTAAISPVNAVSVGDDGAQGSNATGGGMNKRGGDGGLGGAGGDVTVTVGTDVTGTAEDTIVGVSGLTIISLGGMGGAGAKGNSNGVDGVAGIGGQGGAISATLDGQFTSRFASAFISSQGGQGGRGRSTGAGFNSQGADANIGGNAGTVNVGFLNASGKDTNLYNGRTGVLVQSAGGAGGDGGSAFNADGSQGGGGGKGGNGNDVTVAVGPNVTMISAAPNDAPLRVLSIGGTGGRGNSSGGSGGIAGAGGAAGNVTLTFDGGGLFAANQSYSPGVLAQSLGGNGGDGGTPSRFVIGPNGGSGSAGGTAGTVNINGSGVNARTGIYVDTTDLTNFEGSPGVLAQSIGGGGSGSSASGVFAVGGNGVAGNNVAVSLQSTVLTYGFGSAGLMAQSIGGGGGKAGDASGDSVGIQYTVGGTGGGGGDGSTVKLTSLALSQIETKNAHAPGLLVQSVGGGGGQGGAAYSKDYSAGFGSSMALGGSGGNGGSANLVTWADEKSSMNEGRITTAGSDSHGIVAQAIGGGGGMGGASTAKARCLVPLIDGAGLR